MRYSLYFFKNLLTNRPVRYIITIERTLKCSTVNSEEGFDMKKKFKLQDLDCANCAQKMEDAIKKIDGVSDASVNFMMQKMTIEAAEEKFDEIMKQVVAACKKVEPDCVILM